MVKKTIEVDLRWWEIRQNNSGGSFYVDENVAHYVLVQATSAEEAERKMEALTDESGRDWCECCGERWYIRFEDSDGTDEPTIYGEPLNTHESWGTNYEARLHHYDGTIEKVVLKERH